MSDYLWTPEGFDLGGLLGPLDSASMAHPRYRREVCRDNPLRFALTYMPHKLQSRETGGRHSLSQLHIDMAANALSWRTPKRPREHRKVWIAPRESGKSTWKFEILPMWAMAFNWRLFPVLFSDSGDQAAKHFRSIKKELEGNPLLIADFPELCTPALRRGNRTDVDNSTEYHSKGGHMVVAKGINARTLGLKPGSIRPDLICLDDVEPAGSHYSPGQKQKRLATIIEAIFPMNYNACVEMIGTTTMYGSIIHDAVRAALGQPPAEWISEENVKCRYYPPVYKTPSGREESLWPQRWTMDDIRPMRGTRTFALNFSNMPLSQNKGWWERTDFQWGFPWAVERQVLVIDPAVTSKGTSDFTGIAVVGTDAAQRGASVDFCAGVRLSPKKTRELVHWLLMENPKITTVIIETNQGGDYVVDRFKPFPRKVQLITKHESLNKVDRIRTLHDYYERDWVWHGPSLQHLETQMLAFPDVDHDDDLDAVARGVDHFLELQRTRQGRPQDRLKAPQ